MTGPVEGDVARVGDDEPEPDGVAGDERLAGCRVGVIPVVPPSTETSFSTSRVALWTALTVTVPWLELIVAAPNVAWALAWLVTEPALRSPWAIVNVAEQLTVALGARVAVGGQVTVVLSSVTVTGPARVTLPVLRTR